MRLPSLQLGTKIGFALLVPFLVALGFAGYLLVLSWSTRSEMAVLGRDAAGVSEFSRLVHELQRERGASAVFIGSKGAQLRAELPAQRRLTDERRRSATAFIVGLKTAPISDEYRSAITAAEEAVAALDGKRGQIDALAITATDSNSYFTSTIAKLLTVTSEIAKASNQSEVTVAISGYVSFMQGKERAGQERATGAAGVAAGKFDLAGYVRVLGLRAAQDTYFGVFEDAATPAQREVFRQTMAGPVTDNVTRMRDVIAAGGLSGEMRGLDGKQWFDATTLRIDALKKVEDRIAGDLAALTADVQSKATRALIMLAAVIVPAMTLGVLVVVFIRRGVVRPLRAMTATMGALAAGDLAVTIPRMESRDEIGQMADAVSVFRDAAVQKARLESDAREQEKRTAAERDAAMQRMAAEFEASVGDIVKAAVAGDFSRRVDVRGKTGLVLNVGTSLNDLCENVAGALDDLTSMLDALAQGDLTRRITAEYHGNFAVLKDNANTTADRIGGTITEIKQSAREVTSAAAEISTSTTDLSQRTEEQAASLEETSASMEEIAATVKKNAENAQQANQSASGAREVADRGGQVVAQAVQAMSRIEESSRKISDIIGVIDEIARQTNLLALNAAVEAARAGDAGRGFAVVASEVRSLAQRSSQAAKDITGLIVSSNGQVREGVELVNDTGKALAEIVESIKLVAGVVSEIANASTEQATGIEEVNKALTQMDEVTQQNSALVEENAATAKTLEQQALAMDERVAFFQINEAGGHTAQGAAKRPAAAPSAAKASGRGRGPVGRTQGALALKKDPGWQEF
ncbi:MAG: nitrate- and nitrite sensing domain-containing protein [Hyphomicrobiales bacterium]|nr:nitrate- and nitrite sensing domain-containing protein [Hyphomicrobiales bacterium]